MFNRFNKASYLEVEASYAKTSPVKEICVFGVAGKKRANGADVLWAIVRPDLEYFKEYNEVNLRAVLKERFDNTSQTLPYDKRIEGFTITLDALPHTFYGKIKRDRVLKLYQPKVIAERAGIPTEEAVMSKEDVLLVTSSTGKMVLDCLQKQSGTDRAIAPSDSLELDLGVDSLGRIELATCLEVAFNVDIKNEDISRVFTVEDLIFEIENVIKRAKGMPFEDRDIALGPDYWKDLLQVPPKEMTMEMLELGTGYFAWLFRFILTGIDLLFMKIFFRIKEKGAKNVPKQGAFIIYGNHTSFLDGPAIGACLPRRRVFQLFYFVFGPYFFRPFVRSRTLRNLVKMGRFIPFDYSTHFLEALRSSYYVLAQGKGLCFFPEGLRSSTGEVLEFKKGFGVLAKESGALLVPVAIKGAFEAWPSTAQYPKHHPINVIFGEPLNVQDLEKEGLAMGAKDGYEAICIAARKKLIALKSDPY